MSRWLSSGQRDLRNKEVVRLREEAGLTYNQIATRLNIARDTIGKVLKEVGLTRGPEGCGKRWLKKE